MNPSIFRKNDNNEYLKTKRGGYAERNGGFFPWLTRFDLTLAQDLRINLGKKPNSIQIRFDIANVGNLFNNKWGVGYLSTTGSFNNATPLTLASIDANGVPSYRLGTQVVNGETILLKDSFTKAINVDNVWQAQFGIRYTFN